MNVALAIVAQGRQGSSITYIFTLLGARIQTFQFH